MTISLESLEDTPVETAAMEYLNSILYKDVDSKKPTLLGKWLPSENASSPITKRLASKFRKFLGITPKNYRKMLSALRETMNVVERKMCAGEWNEINYQNVPSRAASIYRTAFHKHDGVRYAKFLTKVEKGKAKINASVLYPYDIVREIRSKGVDDRTLNAQWKALPNLWRIILHKWNCCSRYFSIYGAVIKRKRYAI